MSKCLAINTENGLEPTAQTNNVATAMKLALLQKQAMQSFAPNTREIITESCDWSAPVTGEYSITLIGGGDGSGIDTAIGTLWGGSSGEYKKEIVKLEKGQVVSVTIGAAGIGQIGDNIAGSTTYGGITSFGDISTVHASAGITDKFCGFLSPALSFYLKGDNTAERFVDGAGLGGASTNLGDYNGKWYGAGGASYYRQKRDVSPFGISNPILGNGYQGCVILEYYDPTKSSLPTINDKDQIPYIELLERLNNLEKYIHNTSGVYNDKIVITESGDFEIPYDGYYEVTCIGGGNGGLAFKDASYAIAQGGASGHIYKTIKFYKAGTIIPVTIGAGGASSTTSTIPAEIGGTTSFGDIIPDTADKTNIQFGATKQETLNLEVIRLWGHSSLYHGYGAGARTRYITNLDPQILSEATQGAVILKFFNPEKAYYPQIDDTDLLPYAELVKRFNNLQNQITELAAAMSKYHTHVDALPADADELQALIDSLPEGAEVTVGTD